MLFRKFVSLPRLLFQPLKFGFATADVKIDSIPGNRPPLYEESVHGKYAGVLFAVASEKNILYDVLEEMKYFKDLYDESEEF